MLQGFTVPKSPFGQAARWPRLRPGIIQVMSWEVEFWTDPPMRRQRRCRAAFRRIPSRTVMLS